MSRSELPLVREDPKGSGASTLVSMVEGRAQQVAAAGGSYVSDHETSSSPVSLKRKRKTKASTVVRPQQIRAKEEQLNDSTGPGSATETRQRE